MLGASETDRTLVAVNSSTFLELPDQRMYDSIPIRSREVCTSSQMPASFGHRNPAHNGSDSRT